MSGAQYLRQLLSPLGVYDLEGPFQNGELEALGAALDQAEDALDELHRESCLATARDWGLERTAALFRRRPVAATPAPHRRRQLYAGCHQRYHLRLRCQCPGAGNRGSRNSGGVLPQGAWDPTRL